MKIHVKVLGIFQAEKGVGERMTGKLPSLKPRKVIRALERNGFYVHHTTGSHYILKKGALRVTVAYHNKDLKPGTLSSIISQSGLTVEEFLDLL
jgi:predicted RNA binding protein YcfA (HicA-like mRNA interferase family)